MDLVNCVHCGHPGSGTYCSNCGEELVEKELTLFSVVNGFFKTILNLDKGLLLVLKSMVLNPKEFCFSYLKGRRKGIVNPITFLFISITLSILFENMISGEAVPLTKADLEANSSFTNMPTYPGYEDWLERFNNALVRLGSLIAANQKLFSLLMVLPLVISAKLVFKRFRFVEYVAIISNIFGLAYFIDLLLEILLSWPGLSERFRFFKLVVFFDFPLVLLLSLIRVFRTKETWGQLVLLGLIILFLFWAALVAIYICTAVLFML